MGKVIILEGPDGGGKTTLAQYLCTEADFDYKHEGPPPPDRDQLEYYKTILFDALESPHNTVFDRLYLGECVYGPIIRGVDRLGLEALKLFERVLASKTVHQYVCLPSEHALKSNYLKKMQDKNDYVGGQTNHRKVINMYYAMILRPFMKVYDYEVDTPQSVIDEPFDRPLPKGTIGHKNAKYLFVGDVPNHHHVDWPFFAINNSSAYFNRALEMAGIEEKDIALSNAYGPGGETHDPLEICNSFFKLEQIILMGAKAQEWFAKGVGSCTIPVRFIAHPAYLNRFKGHNPTFMAEEIRKELEWRY